MKMHNAREISRRSSRRDISRAPHFAVHDMIVVGASSHLDDRRYPGDAPRFLSFLSANLTHNRNDRLHYWFHLQSVPFMVFSGLHTHVQAVRSARCAEIPTWWRGERSVAACDQVLDGWDRSTNSAAKGPTILDQIHEARASTARACFTSERGSP